MRSPISYDENLSTQYINSTGQHKKVLCWTTGKSKAVVIGIHGGMSHPADFTHIGKVFRDQGISLVCPELRGHGQGKIAHVEKFQHFLDDLSVLIAWVKRKFPGKPIMLLGHSMGGLICSQFILKKMPGHQYIKACIVSAPFYASVSNPGSTAKRLLKLGAKFFPGLPYQHRDLSKSLTHDLSECRRIDVEIAHGIRASGVSLRLAHELVQATEWVQQNFQQWNLSSLFLIAGQDKIADPLMTQKLIEKCASPLVTTEVYPKNYHENFNEKNRDEIFERTLAWINFQLQLEVYQEAI